MITRDRRPVQISERKQTKPTDYQLMAICVVLCSVGHLRLDRRGIACGVDMRAGSTAEAVDISCVPGEADPLGINDRKYTEELSVFLVHELCEVLDCRHE